MKITLLSLPTNKTHRIVYFLATPIVGALLTLTTSALADTIFALRNDAFIGLEWYTVISALLIAPFLETLLCQSVPFAWSTAKKKSFLFTVLLMSIPFAVFHASKGMAAFFGTLVGGLILAVIYILWSTAQKPAAFAATAATHFLHNAVTLTIMLHSGVKLNPIVLT